MSDLEKLQKFINKENSLNFDECDPLFIAGYKFAMDRVIDKIESIEKEKQNDKCKTR